MDIFRVRNLTTDTNPNHFYPTATQLQRQKAFVDSLTFRVCRTVQMRQRRHILCTNTIDALRYDQVLQEDNTNDNTALKLHNFTTEYKELITDLATKPHEGDLASQKNTMMSN